MYTYIYTCIYKTESLCYTSETLQVNYTSVKKKSPPAKARHKIADPIKFDHSQILKLANSMTDSGYLWV